MRLQCRLIVGVGLIVAAMVFGACQDIKRHATDVWTVVVPTDRLAIIEKYNQRIATINNIRAHVGVTFRWIDHDGTKHTRLGDGTLIIRKPHELALVVGKMGQMAMWLGADEERYWFLDRKPGKGREKVAYIGRVENIAITAPSELPLPIAPNQLISLLGIVPLSADDIDDAEMVLIDGVYQLTLVSDTNLSGGQLRLWIDRKTYNPLRIAVIGDDDIIVINSKLSAWKPFGIWARIATHVKISVPSIEAAVVLSLDSENMSDGKDGRIKDVQFDFERIVKTWRIGEIVDLDKAKEQEQGSM